MILLVDLLIHSVNKSILDKFNTSKTCFPVSEAVQQATERSPRRMLEESRNERKQSGRVHENVDFSTKRHHLHGLLVVHLQETGIPNRHRRDTLRQHPYLPFRLLFPFRS